MLAFACFVAATLLSDRPALPPSSPPTAAAVARARDSAVELAMALAADGTPRRIARSRQDIEGASTLVEHGIDGVRLRPIVSDDLLLVEANLRIAERSWINLSARLSPRGSGFPATRLTVGAWSVPAWFVDRALALVDWRLRQHDGRLPPLSSSIRDFAVDGEQVAATVTIPSALVRALGELGGDSTATIDENLLRLVYGRLLAFQVRQPTATFAMTLRHAFGARPNGIDPVAFNRAAFVALAMHTVDPDVRRLAGSNVMVGAPMEVVPPDLRVGGRPDLAKHFALSAALTAAFEPRLTRAIGEWKELDDSRTGGSGFSFIDLTADRAGMHLAAAAIDPDTAERVADLLADTNDVALFPTAAHALAEGLSEGEFTRRYGGLAGDRYAQAIERVDRLLERLPLYAPFVRPS